MLIIKKAISIRVSVEKLPNGVVEGYIERGDRQETRFYNGISPSSVNRLKHLINNAPNSKLYEGKTTFAGIIKIREQIEIGE